MLLFDERDAAYLWEMRNSLRTIGGYMQARTEEERVPLLLRQIEGIVPPAPEDEA